MFSHIRAYSALVLIIDLARMTEDSMTLTELICIETMMNLIELIHSQITPTG